MTLAIIIAGFGGGMVRGILGYMKYQYSYKNVGFNVIYFIAMMFLSGVVGTLTAGALSELNAGIIVTGFNAAIAFVAGYAGGDIIENIYRILVKK